MGWGESGTKIEGFNGDLGGVTGDLVEGFSWFLMAYLKVKGSL